MAKSSTYSTRPPVTIRPVSAANINRVERRLANGLVPPEFRIFRRACSNADNILDWETSLRDFSRKNESKGSPTGFPESLRLTYLKDTDFKSMLAKHKNKANLQEPANKRQLVDYMRKLSKEYTEMVRRNGKLAVEAESELQLARLTLTDDTYKYETYADILEDSAIRIEPVGFSEIAVLAGLWGYLRADTKPDLEAFGNTKLAVVVRPNETIEREMDDTYMFMRSHGFDTSLLQRSHSPHVSIFATNHTVGMVPLTPVDFPSFMEFDPPRADINTN